MSSSPPSRLYAALLELVECKDIHDVVEDHRAGVRHDLTAAQITDQEAEYKRRKPLDWENARKALVECVPSETGNNNALAAPSAEYRLSKPEDGASRTPEGITAAPSDKKDEAFALLRDIMNRQLLPAATDQKVRSLRDAPYFHKCEAEMTPEEIVAALRKAAEEIAREGHAGWGNVCSMAADHIESASRKCEGEQGT